MSRIPCAGRGGYGKRRHGARSALLAPRLVDDLYVIREGQVVYSAKPQEL